MTCLKMKLKSLLKLMLKELKMLLTKLKLRKALEE